MKLRAARLHSLFNCQAPDVVVLHRADAACRPCTGADWAETRLASSTTPTANKRNPLHPASKSKCGQWNATARQIIRQGLRIPSSVHRRGYDCRRRRARIVRHGFPNQTTVAGTAHRRHMPAGPDPVGRTSIAQSGAGDVLDCRDLHLPWPNSLRPRQIPPSA